MTRWVKKVGLNRYDHAYDVMVMEDIYFSEPQGIAVGYVVDGQMDWKGLQQAWQYHQALILLKPIANKFFNVESLQDDPKLAAALFEAYCVGKDKAKTEAKIHTGLDEGFYG